MAEGKGTDFSIEERQRMATIAEQVIRPWRDEYWKAEEQRREGGILIRKFLDSQDPECLAIEKQALSWLYELPNAQLAPLSADELKQLVYTQISVLRSRDSR
jgi:hypothetical protein